MSSNIAHERARPWSLAVRLAVGYAVAAFTLLLLASAYAYWALVGTLAHEDVNFMAEEVKESVIVLGSKPDGDGQKALREQLRRESAVHVSMPLYVRAMDLDGRVLAETAGMSGLIPPDAFPKSEPVGGHSYKRHTLKDGRPFYVLSANAMVDSRPVIVHAALDRTSEQRLLERYRTRLVVVLLIGLAACGVTGFMIARRGLRPLGRMATVMEGVSSSTLSERVDAVALPADLSSLAATFNAMLQRLEEAFDRLSQFSADIAHELRTPVHNVRGIVELALARERHGDDVRELLEPCLEECNRLSRLIDNLLFVARAEHPHTQITRQMVDVAEQLAKVQEFYEPAASEAGIALECAVASASNGGNRIDARAELDRQLFQQALCNLVENALAHTPSGGRVRLSAERVEDSIRVEVCDTGSGIPPEHLPFVFDRFRRVDPSRSKHTGGMGLGLALVKSIVNLHGGTATAESTLGSGSRFILAFPIRSQNR